MTERGISKKTLREHWSHHFEFVLSLLSYIIGLGSAWRFPYRVYENGGGSFTMAYLIMYALFGLPLLLLEMTLGQFSSRGPISVWNAVPLFKGVGYGMFMITSVIMVYYMMLIGYCIFYVFASFTTRLPWETCTDEWVERYSCRERHNWTLPNVTNTLCATIQDHNQLDFHEKLSNCTGRFKLPAEIYWRHVVLEQSTTVTEGGSSISWKLLLCLLLAWLVVFLAAFKGIKSIGKAVYFTSTVPYIIVTVLLVPVCQLDGALKGILFYLTPRWNKLKELKVWYTAATQVSFSLGIALGGIIMSSSYNHFKENYFRDAYILAALNTVLTLYIGFAIFPVLGFLSEQTGVPVEEVLDKGPGLAFVTYAEGLSMLPLAPLWSCLFFLMLVILGLAVALIFLETLQTTLSDEFPILRHKQKLVTSAICIVLFCLGIPLCSKPGIFLIQLFDTYGTGFSAVVLALVEVFAISAVYGIKRFSEDIEMMIGKKPNIYWRMMWMFVTPVVLVLLLIFLSVQHTPLSSNTYTFPIWMDWVGWSMVGLALIFVPLFMVIETVKRCATGTALQTFKLVIQPTALWGPAMKEDCTGRYIAKTSVADLGPTINEYLIGHYSTKASGSDSGAATQMELTEHYSTNLSMAYSGSAVKKDRSKRYIPKSSAVQKPVMEENGSGRYMSKSSMAYTGPATNEEDNGIYISRASTTDWLPSMLEDHKECFITKVSTAGWEPTMEEDCNEGFLTKVSVSNGEWKSVENYI